MNIQHLALTRGHRKPQIRAERIDEIKDPIEFVPRKTILSIRRDQPLAVIHERFDPMPSPMGCVHERIDVQNPQKRQQNAALRPTMLGTDCFTNSPTRFDIITP